MGTPDWETMLKETVLGEEILEKCESLGFMCGLALQRGKLTSLLTAAVATLLGGKQLYISLPLKRQACVPNIFGFPSTYLWAQRTHALYIHGYGEMTCDHHSVDPWNINSMILFHITKVIWIEYSQLLHSHSSRHSLDKCEDYRHCRATFNLQRATLHNVWCGLSKIKMIWGSENSYLLCSTPWAWPRSGRGCGNEPNASTCESVYSICNSLLTEASIIPCLNKKDPFEEKNKEESNSLMPKNQAPIYMKGLLFTFRAGLKMWTEKKWYQEDVRPLHLCHKHQNVQFGFDVVTDIIVQNSTKECGLCWDDGLRKSYYNTERWDQTSLSLGGAASIMVPGKGSSKKNLSTL